MQLHFSCSNQMLSCTELHLKRNCRLGSFSPCISKFSISQKYSTLNIKAMPPAHANMFVFFLSQSLKKIVCNLVLKHTANICCAFFFVQSVPCNQNDYALDNKMSFWQSSYEKRRMEYSKHSALLRGVMTVVVPSSGLDKGGFAVLAVLNVVL